MVLDGPEVVVTDEDLVSLHCQAVAELPTRIPLSLTALSHRMKVNL